MKLKILEGGERDKGFDRDGYMPTYMKYDSDDYYVLYRSGKKIKEIEGLTCEIGVRLGGGTESILQGCLDTNQKGRVHICIDPYGNIDYVDVYSQNKTVKLGYDNQMAMAFLNHCSGFCHNNNIYFIPFFLEDTEFFKRYSTGVPVYRENKEIINTYALVHFDGPHEIGAVIKEIEFFEERTTQGGIWIFDDVQMYREDELKLLHNTVHNLGFEDFILGEKRKHSFIKK